MDCSPVNYEVGDPHAKVTFSLSNDPEVSVSLSKEEKRFPLSGKACRDEASYDRFSPITLPSFAAVVQSLDSSSIEDFSNHSTRLPPLLLLCDDEGDLPTCHSYQEKRPLWLNKSHQLISLIKEQECRQEITFGSNSFLIERNHDVTVVRLNGQFALARSNSNSKEIAVTWDGKFLNIVDSCGCSSKRFLNIRLAFTETQSSVLIPLPTLLS